MLDDEDADYMDDGDAHMPDFSLPPLEKNRVFASLGLEKGVAFVENSDFKPPEITEKSNHFDMFSFLNLFKLVEV